MTRKDSIDSVSTLSLVEGTIVATIIEKEKCFRLSAKRRVLPH